MLKEKVCGRCKVIKPTTEFHKCRSKKDGLMPMCKVCNINRMLDHHKENYTPEVGRNRVYKRHGISEEVYLEKVMAQGGKCAICDQVPNDYLNIDHDHKCCNTKFSCGQCIRGLLCGGCNKALGGFGDDEATLQRAIEYLRFFS